MSQLTTIISQELKTDLRSKSFWIATFLLPVLAMGFGVFMGYISEDSDALNKTMNPVGPEPEEMTALQVLAMMMGIFLAMFIMIYGAQIFNKVKTEKSNRIAEIIVACVPGRTLMCAKVLSVGLTGVIQLLLWGSLIALVALGFYLVFPLDIPFEKLLDIRILITFVWGVVYFLGGYVFFGSLFAASGALTDKNNENQEYMTIITFILLSSFYIGLYAVDHLDSPLTQWCRYIPFTSPTIGAISAISGAGAWWETALSVAILYASAFVTLSLAGKIYTSALLLKGKKFTPKDILVFMRSK